MRCKSDVTYSKVPLDKCPRVYWEKHKTKKLCWIQVIRVLQETANKKRKWRPIKAKINFHFRYGRVSLLCFIWFKAHMWMCQVNEIYLSTLFQMVSLKLAAPIYLKQLPSIYILYESQRQHEYIVNLDISQRCMLWFNQRKKNVFKKIRNIALSLHID